MDAKHSNTELIEVLRLFVDAENTSIEAHHTNDPDLDEAWRELYERAMRRATEIVDGSDGRN